MNETELNKGDKLRLKADIKISLVLGLFFFIALIVIVGIIPVVFLFFGKQPATGFMNRSLYVLGLLFIPFLILSWTSILKYCDIRKGKKFIIKTQSFEVVKKKDSAFILIQEYRKKIKIDVRLIAFINVSQPLTIEITSLSKSLLFISQNNVSLLDLLYSEASNRRQ